MKSTQTKARETKEAAKWFRDRLNCDSATGALTWKCCEAVRNDRRGQRADFETKTALGYRRQMIHGGLRKIFIASRVVWLLCNGEWPADTIDHIDGNSMLNAISNLRDVSIRENRKNLPLTSSNKSGVIGVCWHAASRKWSAEILVERKKVYLGLFGDLASAATARKNAEVLYGFHSNHGRSR